MDDSMNNLPLFNWKPPRKVILFPLTKRIGKVRHTARLLSSKNGDDANLYWKQVIAATRKHLSRVGQTPDEIDTEIRTFFDAVQSELVRLSYEGSASGNNNPKGAA